MGMMLFRFIHALKHKLNYCQVLASSLCAWMVHLNFVRGLWVITFVIVVLQSRLQLHTLTNKMVRQSTIFAL